MRLKVLVNSTDFSDAVLFGQTRISKELSGRVATAGVAFVIGNNQGRYDEAIYDQATYGVDVSELAEIELRDADLGTLHFAGYISKTSRSAYEDSHEWTLVECECNDWTIILERTVVPSATFTGQTNQAIVQALIGTYAPQLSAPSLNVLNTTTVPYFEVKDKTLRQALDDLKELTGDEYRVGFDKVLHWFPEGTYPAAFGLSTERVEYRIDNYDRDAIKPINRAIVLGGLLPGGSEIKVQYDDPVSQQLYGVHTTTIVDREITLASTALLRAQSTVEEFAYPQESGTLLTWKDGLDIGQTVDLYHEQLGVDGQYLIRSLEITWDSGGPEDLTQYQVEFGRPQPRLDRLLRMLDARTRALTQIPQAVPVAGTVSDASIASGGLSADVIESVNAEAIIGTITAGQIGSINAANIIGTITAGQIGSVNAAAILGQLTATQIATVNAGTIQGVITAGQIGSVNATTIQGVIVSAQVADDLINRLSLYSAALRPIPRLASDPVLPNADYPPNSVWYNTTLGVFRKNNLGTPTTVTETDAVTGKLEYWHVGTIKAGSIIGLIAAGQIDTITASQITGQVSASQIASVNASAIVGSISASQIGTVNASAIQGSITASQIGSVNASSLVGGITSSQISSVSASSITGTISSSQISSVSASSITGTITAGQIGSINAGTINIGQIQNSQIAGVSASKLTAGTIDASVISVINLSASNITSGTMSVARLAAGTMSVAGTQITMDGSGITVAGFGLFQVGGTQINAVSAIVAGFVRATRYEANNGADPGVLLADISYAKPGGGSGLIRVRGGIVISVS